MDDYTEIIKGRIIDRQSGEPVKGAEVEIYDKDMMLDDYLGTVTTDKDGRFEVEFTWAEYKDTVFEGRPDIFLRVFNPATGNRTKSKVFHELSGVVAEDDDSVEVMDLGDVAVD
jgi:5-hydroxyisourate hydrolase-like protein (transthyretin family)